MDIPVGVSSHRATAVPQSCTYTQSAVAPPLVTKRQSARWLMIYEKVSPSPSIRLPFSIFLSQTLLSLLSYRWFYFYQSRNSLLESQSHSLLCSLPSFSLLGPRSKRPLTNHTTHSLSPTYRHTANLNTRHLNQFFYILRKQQSCTLFLSSPWWLALLPLASATLLLSLAPATRPTTAPRTRPAAIPSGTCPLAPSDPTRISTSTTGPAVRTRASDMLPAPAATSSAVSAPPTSPSRPLSAAAPA